MAETNLFKEVSVNFRDVIAVGKVHQGCFRMTIECQEHPGRPRREVNGETMRVRVVCPNGCVLGEWASDKDLRKEAKEIQDRLVWDLKFEQKKWADRKKGK